MVSQNNNTKFNFYFVELLSEYHKSFGPYYATKLLSVNPDYYPDAPRKYLANKHLDSFEWEPLLQPMLLILERNGEPTALLITAGFRDVLHIGNQSRPNIFDLQIEKPDVIYKSVYEINERVRMARFLSKEELRTRNKMKILKAL
eukprot:303988_1